MLAQRTNIGIDIGNSSIKLVELLPLRKEKKFKLLNFVSQPVSAKNKGEVLTEIAAKLKLKNKFVNVAMGGESVIVRLITIPKMSKEELKSSLRFEAEKFIPFDIKDVEMQTHVLEDNLKDNKMRVLLAAVKNKDIEALVNVLIGAGLNPMVIDVESFALCNAYEVNHPNLKETCLLLNVGERFSNINIIEEGVISFSRDVLIGGNDFTQQIMKTFELEYKEAEKLKIEPKDKSAEVLKVLETGFLNLKDEIGSSLDYFESQSQKKVNKIYISGGSASLLGLSEFLKENFEIEVEIWDVTAVMEKDASIDLNELNKVKSQLAAATGLALR